MNIEYPSYYQQIHLSELFDLIIGGDWGKDPGYTDDNYKLVYCIRCSEIKNWHEDKGNTASLRKVKESSLQTRKLQENDILIEISGGGPDQPVGRTVIIDKAAININPDIPKICTNFMRLARPSKYINSKYLNLFLQFFYKSGNIVNYQGGSNNLRNLKTNDYLTITCPLPPLAEQHRIVAKIEELFSSLDKGIESLKTAQEQLKTYRQAVLKWAFEGKLTNENVKDGELPEGWKWVDFGSLFKGTPQNGLYKPSSEYGSGTPILRIDGFYNGQIVTDYDFKRVRLSSDEISKYLLSPDDIVVNRVNSMSYLGKCGLVKTLKEKTVFESNVMKIQLDFQIAVPRFATYYLSSLKGIKELTKNAKQAVNQASINQTDVANAQIPLPPLPEQALIVAEIEKRLSVCDKLEESITQSLSQAEALRQSILKKAFEGKLVPQDLSDEPASVLLERIRAERASSTPVKKARTPKEKK